MPPGRPPSNKSIEFLKHMRENPIDFVKWAFHVTPDKWQADVLNCLPGKEYPKISMQACVGPGKSALLAWVTWYFLALYSRKGEHPQGNAVSITQDNLRDHYWSEVAKWQGRSDFLKEHFTVNAERIFHREHSKTWFISARSFSRNANAEEVGASLAGLHARFVLVIIDEGGAINPAILKTASQSLTSCEWGHVLLAGNPLTKAGALHQAAVEGGWKVFRITGDPDDPQRSPRVDIEWAREEIRKNGRENAWVKANILGEFPDTAFNALIGPDEVRKALGKHLRPDEWNWAQKRIGIDVARFGEDRTVLFPRQGRASFMPVVMRQADVLQISGRYALAKAKFRSEYDAIDDCGGWAGGVIDNSKQAGNFLAPVNGSSSANDPR